MYFQKIVPLGSGAISGTLCWFLEDQVPSSNYSQATFDEQMSTLLSPCITSITATMATFFMNPLENDGCRRRLPEFQRISCLLDFSILLCWGHPLLIIHRDTDIFMFLTYQRCLSRYSYKYPHQHFISHMLSKTKPPTKPLGTMMNQYKLITLLISPSGHNEKLAVLLKVVPSRWILLQHCPVGMFQKEV